MIKDGVSNRLKKLPCSTQYRRLLFICYKYKETYSILPFSQDIDEFWHNHILGTRQYPKDCKAIFGEFIHDNLYTSPLVGDSDTAMSEGFEQAQTLYHQKIGEYIYEVRPLYWQRLRRCVGELFKPVLIILTWLKPRGH